MNNKYQLGLSPTTKAGLVLVLDNLTGSFPVVT